MTSIENAIETVEHQIEIPSELPTDNPVRRYMFDIARTFDTSSERPNAWSIQLELILSSVMLV